MLVDKTILLKGGFNASSFSIIWSKMGFPAIGNNALGVFKVRGQSRFAYPPASTIAYN